MPKAVRTHRKVPITTSSLSAAASERPRRSTRVKPTCDDAGNSPGTSNTRSKSRSKPSRGRSPKRSQPLYTRSASQVNSDPNRGLPLFKLPTELLKLIAGTYLPLESAVSLSLTCKEALSTIGSWAWADLKKEKRWSPARTNFLEGLARDWQQEGGVQVDVEFCSRCNTLHPRLKEPSRYRKTALTTYCFGQEACIDYLPQNFDSGDDENNEERGWSLVFLHVIEALQVSFSHEQKGQYGPPIPLLAGDFSTTFPNSSVRLQLSSSGRRVDGNLLVRHEYVFRKAGLCAKDILDLRIYICPHQCTTTTGPREKSCYLHGEANNSPMFTYAINSAFPKQRQTHFSAGLFRKPTPHESKSMNEAEQAEGPNALIWSCRSCSTKYKVERLGNGDLRILSWHCFGRDLLHAQRYWKQFVRREGKLLGRDKRNDEWWSPSGQGVQDFETRE